MLRPEQTSRPLAGTTRSSPENPHSASSTSPEAAPAVLPRKIGLWSAVAILVGTTIGSGIFRSPASIANRLPAATPLLAVWVAGGVLALCGALVLAELAGAFPDTGGIYVFIREGWGRLPAFLFGWSELIVIRAAALGAIATTFAEYLIRVAGYDPSVAPYDARVHYVAAVAILGIGTLNYVGVRWGTFLQNTLTVIKCGGLIALVLLSFLIGLPHGFAHNSAHAVSTPASTLPSAPTTIVAFALALVSVLWVYDGWADVSFVSGEIKDPVRNLPRVLIYGTLAIIAIYLLANIAYLLVLPMDVLRHSKLVAADTAVRLIGPSGAAIMGVIVMLSSFGALNGSMLTSPRIWWAMAHDGLLFKRFATVHPKYETPSVAILVATLLGVVFVMLRTFEQLADTFVTAILPFYALSIAAIFPLRRRATYHPPLRAFGYPLTPILFITATAALLISALADPAARVPTSIVFLMILAGIPVYYCTPRLRTPKS